MTTWIDRRPPIRTDVNIYDVLEVEELTTYSKDALLSIRDNMLANGLLKKVPDVVKEVNKQILDAQQAPRRRKNYYHRQPCHGSKRKFSFITGGSNSPNWRVKKD